jgi:hypothetical protein
MRSLRQAMVRAGQAGLHAWASMGQQADADFLADVAAETSQGAA